MSRKKSICYHEAGHCLGGWFFDLGGRFVTIAPEQMQKLGPLIFSNGQEGDRLGCVVSSHTPERYPDSSFETAEMAASFATMASIRAEMHLIFCFVGLAAEARFRKMSFIGLSLYGGKSDWEQAEKIAAQWFPEEADERVETAIKRAQALVRSDTGWAGITALAEQLLVQGTMDREEVDGVLVKAFGGYRLWHIGAWFHQWPPTLAQLRAGHIPDEMRRAV